jgi:hypothetical protein
VAVGAAAAEARVRIDQHLAKERQVRDTTLPLRRPAHVATAVCGRRPGQLLRDARVGRSSAHLPPPARQHPICVPSSVADCPHRPKATRAGAGGRDAERAAW